MALRRLTVFPLVQVCLLGVFPFFCWIFLFGCYLIRLLGVNLFVKCLSVHEVCHTIGLIAVCPSETSHHHHRHDRPVRKEKSVTTGESFCQDSSRLSGQPPQPRSASSSSSSPTKLYLPSYLPSYLPINLCSYLPNTYLIFLFEYIHPKRRFLRL